MKTWAREGESWQKEEKLLRPILFLGISATFGRLNPLQIWVLSQTFVELPALHDHHNFSLWTDFWWKRCKNFCTILLVWDINRLILKCWSHINDVALVSMPVTPRPRGVTVLSLQSVHLSVRLSRPSLWLWYPKIALRGFPSNSAQMVTAIQGWTDQILEVVPFNLTFLFLQHHFPFFY